MSDPENLTRDDLVLLRAFRSEIGEPDRATQARVLEEILTTQRQRRGLFRRSRPRLIVSLAVGAAAAAASLLLLASPWRSGPGALARAQAAVVVKKALAAVSPTPDAVFHSKSELTFVPQPGARRFVTVAEETWKQTGGPHRFRLVNPLPLSPGIEVGGSSEPRRGFVYSRTTDTLYRDDRLAAARTSPGLPMTVARLDEIAQRLRGAIKAGAPVTRTRIDGRQVYRIGTGTTTPAGYDGWAYYVDVDTYTPVRIETQGFPLTQPSGKITTNSYVQTREHPASMTIERVLAYENLPATEANLALADIETQHASATKAEATAMPRALRTKLQPLAFVLPTPTLNPAGTPNARLLIDPNGKSLGRLHLDQPLQTFMAVWSNPTDFSTAQLTLDPRDPAVAIWRAHDLLPWAVIDFSDTAALHARSIYYRGPFTTSRGDRNGTNLNTFLAHWPEHGQAETTSSYTHVTVGANTFWFSPNDQLLAVQIGIGRASTYAGFPK